MSNAIFNELLASIDDHMEEVASMTFNENDYVLALLNNGDNFVTAKDGGYGVELLSREVLVASNLKRAKRIAENWNAEFDGEEKLYATPVLASEAADKILAKSKELRAVVAKNIEDMEE